MCIPMYEEISRAARGGEEALEVIHSHFEPKFLAEKSERREQKVRRDRDIDDDDNYYSSC